MKLVRAEFLGVALAAAALCAGAQEARWIWYPGDYGIWWGNQLQSERLQWGGRLTPFWPLYEPHPAVSRLVYGVSDSGNRLRGSLVRHQPWGDGKFPVNGAKNFKIVRFPETP